MMFGVDTDRAHSARVYDYWLGGKEHYAADRVAAEQIMAARPDIIPSVRANRAFLARAVRFLAAEAGIDQFLDIGAGLPATNNVHEVAQGVRPQARVVYVDNDPVVLAHARALLHCAADGSTAFIGADLRDTDGILREAARSLDFSRPIAITLLMVLQFISDQEDPDAVVARLVEAMAPGSYLVVSHAASDIAATSVIQATVRYNELVATPLTRRTRAQVAGFFAGLEFVEPGLVQLDRWRPDPEYDTTGPDAPAYCGIGRKP
jgi:O-methyltransferase involved in polyketide biosynthesis